MRELILTHIVEPMTRGFVYVRDFFNAHLRDPLVHAWEMIVEKLRPILEPLGMIADKVSSGVKAVASTVAETSDVAFDVFRKNWNAVNAETERAAKQALAAQHAEDAAKAKTGTTPETRARNYNDFRNSRFDITQKFAEGFDPDRIALAFTSDLAALGERKLQSGFQPVYATR
jgi:hypothetical protein